MAEVADVADVGLLLEGTYPYVAGGVSSWMHQIIRAFPEHRFALCFIGSRPSDYAGLKYELPANVTHLEEHYIHDAAAKPPPRAAEGDAGMYRAVASLHEALREGARGEAFAQLEALGGEMLPGGRLDRASFLYSRKSWEYLTGEYQRRSSEPSFVDYFWTVRVMHEPVWRLAEIAQGFPRVRMLHTISTGYAGYLGALVKRARGCPLLLSEHGIYTKERRIDLFQSQWIRDTRNAFLRDPTQLAYLREMWIRFFEALGRICYDAADRITALYEENRQRQVADGADAARTECIPNGIDIAKLAPLRAARAAEPPPVIALIGRVVPIKDVKTFIRAMRVVVQHLPQAEGWIAGPEDEDAEYARECRNLIEGLGLADKVKLLGFQRVPELLPRVGLVALSSISEALPLVVLEAWAAGVPVVCTEVGACRELVLGSGAEDEALGAAGELVGIADPDAFAGACLRLLGDRDAWRAAQQAGIRRVERSYGIERMVGRFGELYRSLLGAR